MTFNPAYYNSKEALELYYEDEPIVEYKPAMLTALEAMARYRQVI